MNLKSLAKFKSLSVILVLFMISPLSSLAQVTENSSCLEKKGVLIIAHGKSGHSHDSGEHGEHDDPGTHNQLLSHNLSDEWDSTILDMIDAVEMKIPYPLEVAFGMWDQKSFQKAITHLGHQDVCSLLIIPLFISDHSDVIRAQKYQFHLTETNPLPFDPGRVEIPRSIQHIQYSSALNDNITLSQIIEKRAQELSQHPSNEELILVAHGPNSDEDDTLWLRDLSIHSSRLQIPFSKTHIVTLRDDAPAPIQDGKTRELRTYVAEAHAKGLKPIILPVLLAPGGIEQGLIKRLEGLEYHYSNHMLAPDDLLINWIVEQAK